ncbi:TonB-dependent receptor [Spirosoma utsteinense]|uniref:Iron complex outermembrane receptor protein n=1 Tax=Spirosoma utsteinense TaxID=2585773 RepID=A0ABR6WAU4_9BACT|nr:TonB-dependent receptor [Spirosoma utsteinense]MBC3793622.1 iron complex outermembrane receptor protein [Spirosoma utsteinense]
MRQIFKSVFFFGLFIIPLFLSAQNAPVINATVSGTVVDAQSNKRLVGATVAIKGTTNGAPTKEDGQFMLITGQKLPFTVIVSFVGYQTTEVIINEDNTEIKLQEGANQLSDVVITSRRRQESAQDVPIPISVVSGVRAEDAGAFNVNRLKELVPSVQLYASNARNTTLNIRGLGSSFGLTNDGIDPGVGFYVDGVYYARPAATSLDFIDIEQVEVLRGPQGTLFGKNTTAGAFNVVTRAPSFQPGASFETSFGNLNYIQAKASITGPLSKKLAARVSFSGTQRDGTIYNLTTLKPTNTLNNVGYRAQLLYTPSDRVSVTVAGDNSRQRPDGYATVLAGVVPTKRAAYRQFNTIIADLGYKLPTTNPFDRVTDTDTPWRSNNDFGGASVNVDARIGGGKLTSTTAWRYWKWDPSNDRDFTGLPVLTKSQGNSQHQQWTQEIRYAGQFSSRLSGVVGVFLIDQDLRSDPVQTEESGSAQWRFSQSSTSALWKTPGLLDGFGTRTTSRLKTLGGAVFGQLDWTIGDKWHLLPGLRFNYDKKDVDYKRETYGGLQTTEPALLALKNGVYTNQAFAFGVEENNFSGQLTLAYRASKQFNAYATYANSYKPVGVNLGGLPTANGVVLIDLAKVKPEYVTHVEVGVKTRPTPGSTLNLTVYNTDIRDYQTQVQTAEVGVNRGYLANAEKVRVKGVELDGNVRVTSNFTVNGALAYTDGKYISFKNAPVPLEETGGESAFKDISGGVLPGISKWAGSLGGEISGAGKLFSQSGRYFLALDTYYRSSFSSSASPSLYLNIDGYTLLNARVGFRASNGVSILLWARNLTNKDYFEQLLPAAGNAGQYGAVLGDPRTYGTTLRYTF